MVSSGEKSETFEGTTTAEAGVRNLRACDNCPQAPTSGEVTAQSTGIASVLEHADQAEGRRERILDLLCRFHVPASGIALPFFANNLLACLRLAVADQSADETHLRPILDDIEWLATSKDVADACPVPKLREGNPTFGRCATSTRRTMPPFAKSSFTRTESLPIRTKTRLSRLSRPSSFSY
jgi:hypothetical protein